MNVRHIKAALPSQHLTTLMSETNKSLEKKQHSESKKNSRPTLLSKANIANLWLTLAELYKNVFLSKYGIEDTGEWFECLKDLTALALHNGIEKLRYLEAGHEFAKYPPNCMEFRALCLGFYSELRLPSVIDAYRETRSRSYYTSPRWSHPVVKYTAEQLSTQFLAIDDEAEAYKLFKKAYTQVCQLVKQGHEIPHINKPVMLPKPASKHIAQTHLQKLRQHLGA
jgi:hypothetical protein